MLDRLIDVGERLRLNPLGRIHDEQRAFARGKAARHFIGKVHMARCVHEVQLISDAIFGLIVEPDGLRFDRNAALFFNVHIVEHLLCARHFAVGQPARILDETVGERRFTVVDMGDNRKIADEAKVGHGCFIMR